MESLLYTLMADQAWTQALLWLSSIDSRLCDGWPALTPGTLVKTGASPVFLRSWLLAIFWSSFLRYSNLASDWIETIIKLTIAKETHKDFNFLLYPLLLQMSVQYCTKLPLKKEPNIIYRFPKYLAQNVLLEEKLLSLCVINLIQFISLTMPFVCLNFEHAKLFGKQESECVYCCI